MKRLAKSRGYVLALCLVLTMVCSVCAWASSDDNSLYDLGITTEGVTVEPEFDYSTWEYDVVVPAGTTTLELSPVASSEQAVISDVSGTTLDSDGTATVLITVTSGSGIPFTYTLHVTSAAAPAAETEVQTEAPTEPATEKQTEAQTEDSQYVKVDRNTIQEAENTITDLKAEITELRETISLYTKVIYALIGVGVVLFFIVINLMLRKKDLKAELNDYRSYGYEPEPKKSKRSQSKPKQSKQQTKTQPKTADSTSANRRQQEAENMGSRVENVRQAPRASAYQPDQDLDVSPQSSRRVRTMPAYEEENVVRQAALQSKNEDAVQRETQAAKRQEAAAAKAKERAQEQEAKAAAKQEEKLRAAEEKQQQKQAKKRRSQGDSQSEEDGGVKIDFIDL